MVGVSIRLYDYIDPSHHSVHEYSVRIWVRVRLYDYIDPSHHPIHQYLVRVRVRIRLYLVQQYSASIRVRPRARLYDYIENSPIIQYSVRIRVGIRLYGYIDNSTIIQYTSIQSVLRLGLGFGMILRYMIILITHLSSTVRQYSVRFRVSIRVTIRLYHYIDNSPITQYTGIQLVLGLGLVSGYMIL